MLRQQLYEEARGNFETGLRFHRDTNGSSNSWSITCMINLSIVAVEASEPELAEERVQEALRIRRADTQDPCDGLIVMAEAVLGTVLFAKGKYDESEKLMLGVLQRQLSTWGTSHVHTLNTIQALVIQYEMLDRLEDARKLAIEHFDVLFTNSRLQEIPSRFTFGCKNLGTSHFEAAVSRLLSSRALTSEQIAQVQESLNQ